LDFSPSSLLSKALSRKAAFKAIARKLKALRGSEADAMVNNLHQSVFKQIDCLQCAGCCRGLGPRLIRSDLERLATRLGMKGPDFTAQYTRIDEDGDYVFKTMPCPFLQSDNHCSVYDVRPRACREYSHTDQRNIKSILHLCVKNTETCPAVFEIFERMILK
jgi:uncharacterized protein